MAISVISISSDSSEESVGTSTARVILFGTIPTTIPSIAPTTDLPVIHDDTPLMPTDTPTISPIVPIIPSIAPSRQYTSPFSCTNSSNSDTSERPPLQDPYEMYIAPPRLPRPTSVLVLHRAAAGFLLVRFHDSSLDSPSDSSSATSLDSHSDTSSDSPSRHSLSGHFISDSPCDLPTIISTRPSRKRRRSPTTSVPVASLVPEALSPIRADLLPPCKRINQRLIFQQLMNLLLDKY
ncbi:hypothetical protein Tco_0800098 [Tanacetum coccineum]|uniref:Uncharacterized protein n=1 Tax=Tanacetum coccineum TaxID=301880 RepID=A0ABQ4ZVX1_9ASTR